MDGPYQWTDDLPARNQLVRVANALDGDDREIARATEFRDVDDWVRRTEMPLDAPTRFAAVVGHLSRLAGSGMDIVPVLERLATFAAVAEFDERDAIRALDRERRLRAANEEGRGERGRPLLLAV